MNYSGLMSTDGIKGKGGTGIIGINNLAVGNKTQFYKCLETVTDTAH